MTLPRPPAWGDAHFVPTIDGPCVGSVVYCEIAFGRLEHSGIYVGRGKIVSLSSDGEIVKEGPLNFLDGITAGDTIYVSCNGSSPVGDPHVAKRARDLVGDHRNYNVLLDNCHQFTSECLTGSGQNGDLALWMLKDTAKSVLGANNWLRWNDFPKEDSVAKLPISTGQSLPQLPDVVKVISSVVDWATEREKRIQAEAQLDAEVKMQRMQTKAYAKELETHLKAFMKKLEANEHYIREQLEDRRQSRKVALIAIKGLLQQAHRCIDLLESPSSSEMPSHMKEQIVNTITVTISSAAKAIEKFPSGPLATLD